MTAAALAALLAAAPAAAQGPRPSLAGARRWACFYGETLSSAAWAGLDLAVVDPDSFRVHQETGPLRLAYVSAGEADESRPWWPRAAGKPWLVEDDPGWRGAHRVDPRAPEWRALVAEQASSAAAAGYDGVMLDTLDVAEYLESSAPARFAGAEKAAGDLVLALRAAHPGLLILVNNALPLLDRVGDAVDGVVVEDLYTRCGPKDADPCGATPRAVTKEKERLLRAFRKRADKPVFVILYGRLADWGSRRLRRAARRALKEGFLPYLTTPALTRLGVVAPGGR